MKSSSPHDRERVNGDAGGTRSASYRKSILGAIEEEAMGSLHYPKGWIMTRGSLNFVFKSMN